MKLIISSTTTIPMPEGKNFHNVEIAEVQKYLNEVIIPSLDVAELPDWTLIIRIGLTKGDWIGVAKKGVVYPSEKEVVVGIPMPVPNSKQVSWGIKPNIGSYIPPLIEKNFTTLPANYENFSNFYDWVVDGAKRAIHAGFTRGIVVQGVKFVLHS